MSSQETKYYPRDQGQGDGVEVTSTRAVFGAKTYAMVNLTSVSMGVIPANRTHGIVVAVVGLVITMCGAAAGRDGGPILLFGILALIGGLVLAAVAKEQYAVRIGSAGGESDGLVSPDKGRIQEIVNAVSQAIIKRG